MSDVDESWTVSAAARRQLQDCLAAFREAGLDGEFYPAILWSLGGRAGKASEPERSWTQLAAEYCIGYYARSQRPEGDHLRAIADAKFGYIFFLPSAVDLASNRRLIDYDGDAIVVR